MTVQLVALAAVVLTAYLRWEDRRFAKLQQDREGAP